MEVNDEEKFVGEEFERFYKQLLRHSQFRERIVFQAGSAAELITLKDADTMRQLGLNEDDQDEDYMQYSKKEYAFPRERHVPESYSGVVLRIDSSILATQN